MNRKKKILPPGLFELTALMVALLLLYSCKKENEFSENKKQMLENVLKDANQRIGQDHYDLITEGTYDGELYYEVWAGMCFPSHPMYYNNSGNFFCSNYYWQEDEARCDDNFQFTETEIVYREADNCFDAPPINKYGIQLN